MFGLSLPKILFTAAVILVVWYGFKWAGRLKDQRDKAQKNVGKDKTGKPSRSDDGDGVEDMIECSTCGEYVVSTKSGSCGRADCPY